MVAPRSFTSMTQPLPVKIMQTNRSWHIRLPDPLRGRREEFYKVQLRHEPFTGHRSVSVNGEEVTLPTGSTSRVASNTLTLRLGRHTCSVCIRNAPGHPGRNIYSCVVDGAAVQELNEVVGDGPEGDMDHFISSGDVGVEGVGVARDRYTLFNLIAKLARKGRRVKVVMAGKGG
ncbi:unnamed protein product [Choristocarpus tenellus]